MMFNEVEVLNERMCLAKFVASIIKGFYSLRDRAVAFCSFLRLVKHVGIECAEHTLSVFIGYFISGLDFF